MNVSEVKTNQISSIVGTVAFFARSSAPTGWLKCNGAAISRTDYDDLFDSIGTDYGVGDGSTTFNLPDLRGEFVRCWDDSRGIDSGRSLTATSVADIQDWAVEQFTGSFQMPLNQIEYSLGGIFNNKAYTYMLELNSYITGYRSGSRIYVDSSAQINSSTETRPRNVPLLSCIKY